MIAQNELKTPVVRHIWKSIRWRLVKMHYILCIWEMPRRIFISLQRYYPPPTQRRTCSAAHIPWNQSILVCYEEWC
jgi:hypothetical protein